MRQIHSHRIWIGNVRDRDNHSAIHELRIVAVVDLADIEMPPRELSRELVYCRWPLHDGPGNPDWMLVGALNSVVHLVSSNVPVMVCCSAGMSRSVAVAAVALAKVYKKDPVSTLSCVADGGPCDVSSGFWLQLLRAAAAV